MAVEHKATDTGPAQRLIPSAVWGCAQFLLTPGGPVPGDCLALNGSAGWVDIRLRQPIEPAALSYEHVPTSIAYDSSSAPLRVSVVRSAPPCLPATSLF